MIRKPTIKSGRSLKTEDHKSLCLWCKGIKIGLMSQRYEGLGETPINHFSHYPFSTSELNIGGDTYLVGYWTFRGNKFRCRSSWLCRECGFEWDTNAVRQLIITRKYVR